MVVKISPKDPTFEKSCELIYSLASNRIKERYELWSEEYGDGLEKIEGRRSKGTTFDFFQMIET
ncbi:MAG: hypothetical protein EOM38_07090 [Bacilli bacterium]|nr:hypothetical protein [Bacilli bacterium]